MYIAFLCTVEEEEENLMKKLIENLKTLKNETNIKVRVRAETLTVCMACLETVLILARALVSRLGPRRRS